MHKRDDISEQLSGGMKRKLSIGAAFIGNSKYDVLYRKFPLTLCL